MKLADLDIKNETLPHKFDFKDARSVSMLTRINLFIYSSSCRLIYIYDISFMLIAHLGWLAD